MCLTFPEPILVFFFFLGEPGSETVTSCQFKLSFVQFVYQYFKATLQSGRVLFFENLYFLDTNVFGSLKPISHVVPEYALYPFGKLLKLLIYLLIWKKHCNAFPRPTDKIINNKFKKNCQLIERNIKVPLNGFGCPQIIGNKRGFSNISFYECHARLHASSFNIQYIITFAILVQGQ